MMNKYALVIKMHSCKRNIYRRYKQNKYKIML